MLRRVTDLQAQLAAAEEALAQLDAQGTAAEAAGDASCSSTTMPPASTGGSAVGQQQQQRPEGTSSSSSHVASLRYFTKGGGSAVGPQNPPSGTSIPAMPGLGQGPDTSMAQPPPSFARSRQPVAGGGAGPSSGALGRPFVHRPPGPVPVPKAPPPPPAKIDAIDAAQFFSLPQRSSSGSGGVGQASAPVSASSSTSSAAAAAPSALPGAGTAAGPGEAPALQVGQAHGASAGVEPPRPSRGFNLQYGRARHATANGTAGSAAGQPQAGMGLAPQAAGMLDAGVAAERVGAMRGGGSGAAPPRGEPADVIDLTDD